MAKQKKKASKTRKKKKVVESGAESYTFLSNAVKWLWLCLISGFLFVGALFVIISFTKMPDTSELENPDLEASSIIYAEDGREISRIYSKNREILRFEEINPYLVEALIATEDERFYSHSGIDARGTMRAVVNLSRKGGGSTITQQLAKQFFTNYSRAFIKRVWQKLQEWVISAQFEKRYTKEEIIAMYFNKFDFLNQSFGVGAAAKNYFGKDQKELSIEEAAVLVGMFKSPTRYNPNSNPDRSMQRRNVVLNQMVKNNYLSQDEFDVLKESPIDMSRFKKPVHYKGMAPYFKSTLKKYLSKLLKQDKYRKPDGTMYDPQKDGLKIYTTLDYEMQMHAEAAMRNHMQKLQKKYFNVWSDKDAWKYTEADVDKKKQVQYRKDFLENVKKSTERYKKLRSAHLSDIINKITEAHPKARLWDSDIKRMLNEEASPGYLKKLIRQSYISAEQESVYRAILKDPLWNELKKKRSSFQKRANKIFNTKTKMKVFAYNDAGEKTVTMTPLDSIKYHMEHLQIGSVAMNPESGYIKAWVGGIDNKYFKIDHVLTDNQVGSTFKAFLYATVMTNQEISPCSRIKDRRHEIAAGEMGLMESWAPANSDNKYTDESLTLMEGLRRSRNSISVALLKQLGNYELIRGLVDNMGIPKKKIPKAPSIILGTPDLNVLEMTGAYSAFANNGVFNEPSFITKIENSEGKVIYNHIPDQRRVLNERYNYAMVKLLEYATHKHEWQLSSEFGGKTGTTNDYVDGWFMGISPELVVGTWVGGENSWIRFLKIQNGSGGAMARPFYFDFMKRLEANKLIDITKHFHVPEGELINMDCDLYDAQRLPSKQEIEMKKKMNEFNDEFSEDEFEG